ncbi:uncharacterized protein TrAtP1_011460 [Trichoderma atroviride]|uniref:uncharacterized protein n=1 Tax=Hypocrea atroviridis TaxID=63577 RepID=UPI00331D73E1|nr:hypothetical protein TrAtP1_011460 [Trichoderma atroviride]
MSPMFVLGCCIRRAEAQTLDEERYSVQLGDSLPTRGVAWRRKMGFAPLQSPGVDGQSVHGSEIPTTADLMSLFLHLACINMRAYTPAARATTHLLIWNRHGPESCYTCSSRETQGRTSRKYYHHRLTAEEDR